MKEVYVSIGLVSALGIPFPDETIDEEASAQEAQMLLNASFNNNDVSLFDFHVDYGTEEPFVCVEGDDSLSSYYEDTALPLIISTLRLSTDIWTIKRKPYIGAMGDWQHAVKTLKLRGFFDDADTLDDYVSYHMRKLEENAILVTEDTTVIVQLGFSDGCHLYEAVSDCRIRKAGRPDDCNVDKITELVYPLTAAETGFEQESSCDMYASLSRLAEALSAASCGLFPNVYTYFPIFPNEKSKTGSLSLYASGKMLYHAFELESAFFFAAGEVVLNADDWYVSRAYTK